MSSAQSEVAKAENFLNKGEINKAEIVLEKYFQTNDQDLNAVAYLGDISGFKKDWDKAISYYKVLVEKEPANAEYNFKYGGAIAMKTLELSKLRAISYIPDLKKHLEKAAKLDPTHVKSRRALVELYMQLPGLLGGSEEKARKYAVELKDLNAIEAALARAFIYKETNNEKEALISFKQALALAEKKSHNKKNNYLNYELGKISAEYNIEHQKGLQLLDTYIQNYNYTDIHGLEWVYYRMAQIQAHLQNKAEAIRLVNKALSFRSDFEQAIREKKRIQNL